MYVFQNVPYYHHSDNIVVFVKIIFPSRKWWFRACLRYWHWKRTVCHHDHYDWWCFASCTRACDWFVYWYIWRRVVGRVKSRPKLLQAWVGTGVARKVFRTVRVKHLKTCLFCNKFACSDRARTREYVYHRRLRYERLSCINMNSNRI